MSCQVCKSKLGVGLNLSGRDRAPRNRGTLHWLLKRRVPGRNSIQAERSGDINLGGIPHIALIALYRNGLGVKRALDELGASRSFVTSAIEIIKSAGVMDRDRKPPGPRPTLAAAFKRAMAQYEAEQARLIGRREAMSHQQRRAAALAYYYANHAENKRRAAARARSRYGKIKHTPEYKIKQAARGAVSRIVRKYRGRKQQRTLEYLGCTQSFARLWIERQFKRGMNWNNYGEWEIDHIVPLAAFDLRVEEQRRLAMHYSNLRPLWRDENRTKADTIILHQPELPINFCKYA